MKIGKYEVTSGPNLAWYVVTAILIVVSIDRRTPLPVVAWFIGCVLMIPISFWLHKWNTARAVRHRAFMLENYGNDPWVQEKFGQK
jgi:hypothetical protein